MLGHQNGLVVKLSRFLGNSHGLIPVHCLAHRLQLTVGRAWKNHQWSEKFEKLMNKIYKFYNNRGHKRKAQIRAMAFMIDETYYDFSKIFTVRWLASEYQAVSRVNKSYHLLVNDLEQYQGATENSHNRRRFRHRRSRTTDSRLNEVLDAQYLHDCLTDKNFLPIMKFLLDLLNSLMSLPMKLQSQYDTVIGKKCCSRHSKPVWKISR